VCGLEQGELPWGADGATPSFAICDCCGVEFGLEGRPETRYTEALNDRLAGPTPVGGPRLGRGIVVTLDGPESAAAEHTDPRRHR
jgi:hypothetical protein